MCFFGGVIATTHFGIFFVVTSCIKGTNDLNTIQVQKYLHCVKNAVALPLLWHCCRQLSLTLFNYIGRCRIEGKSVLGAE